MVEGKEGDWECSSCQNRNYAFRSFCNRCKQPRLLVDTKTPADSKWLPRIGDWICSGCSNNNYASREKCKKCGQPKEVAAMPAIALAGASIPTHTHYFARAQGGPGLNMNQSDLQQQGISTGTAGAGWPYAADNKYGLQTSSSWSFGGSSNSGYVNNSSQLLMVPKGWRCGDWICNCGFHNYSSRAQCKKCNAPFPPGVPSSTAAPATADLFPTLGTKRLASEEFVYGWDSKRLNAGDMNSHIMSTAQQLSYGGFAQMAGPTNDQASNLYAPLSAGSTAAVPNLHMHMQASQMTTVPAILGKGAKQWRHGDWMCTNCNNHNFASRLQCNRCNSQKDAISQTVNVV
ncbi:unnamed protein product [Victoria cruziana]